MEITTNIFYIAIGSLSLIIIGLAGWLIHIQNRLKKMLLGKNAESLEDSIRSLSDGLKEQQDFTEEMEKYLTTVEHRLKNSIQSVETIRYNPFKGTGSGGNNSFSTAFLNQHGNGVVITSMYARDRVSMFAKPVHEYVSEYELSEEEQESITTCKKKTTTS